MAGRGIKTRQIHKDVRAMDKAVTGMEKMKHAYIQTKDGMEEGQTKERTTPVKYAEEQISRSTESAVIKTSQQIRRQGGGGV